MKKKQLYTMILTCSLVLSIAPTVGAQNYTKDKAWAEKPAKAFQPVDVFYLPSAGKIKTHELQKATASYSSVGDVYAPTYKNSKEAQKAFATYLKTANNKRPYILAAAPESANLAVELFQKLSPEEQKSVVATYAPGARVVSFKQSKNDRSLVNTTSSHATRKRLEAMRLKNKGVKKATASIAEKPVSKIITQLPAQNFEHSLMVNTERFLENDKNYYKALTKEYAVQAHSFLKGIQQDLKVRDYGLQLRKPRDTRLYTRDIVIHHSGTPTDMDLSAKSIQSMHLNNGWYGIGYHFVIRKNGTVEVGTPLETIGAHSYMHNSNTIGIHLSGNFELARPTAAQLTSLEKLIAHLAQDYRLDLNKNLIWGHRHYNNDTACPGYYLNNMLPEIRQKARNYETKLLAGKSI